MTTRRNQPSRADDDTGTPLRQRAGVPMLLAFFAIAAGLFSLLFFAGADTPGESSVEAGFARDMMVHHSQATEMAEIVRRNTRDDALYALASEIVIVQQTQIGQMRGWLALWDLPHEGKDLAMTWMGHPTEGLMPGMATSEQLARLASLPQAEMEIEFLRLMIPHHQSGVEMAQALLDRTKNPDVRQLAHDVMAGQGPEMLVMQDMLVQRGQDRVPDTITDENGESGGHGGHASSDSSSSMETGDLVPRTLRFAPWTLAVFALAWLAWKVLPPAWPGGAVSAAMTVTAAALLAGAALQAGFIVGQSYEYAGYALIAALAAAVTAAAVITLSLRPAALAGMATSSVLVVLYALLRIVSPIENTAPAGASLAGIISTVLFVLALAACLYTLLTGEEDDEAWTS